MEFFELQNGIKFPEIGFGTYKTTQNNDSEIIKLALKAGYKYFDTASFYDNEKFIAEAITQSGISREEIFLASKLWKTDMGFENAKKAFEKTLRNLNTDYLDLYLIHWPRPDLNSDWKSIDIETWRAFEEIYKSGKAKSIGLSNFLPHHLENIIQNCEIKPMINQLEIHPGYNQEATVNYCKNHNISVQAWSPMGRARVLNDELIIELAEKYNATPAQICIKFCVQKNIMPLPKSSTLERMRENLESLKINLSQEDFWKINTMPSIGWSGEHPDREKLNV